MPQQNRFPEAVIPALGTAAALVKTTTYPMAAGELAFATDTFQLYVSNGTYFIPVTDTAINSILTLDGEVLVDADGNVLTY